MVFFVEASEGGVLRARWLTWFGAASSDISSTLVERHTWSFARYSIALARS